MWMESPTGATGQTEGLLSLDRESGAREEVSILGGVVMGNTRILRSSYSMGFSNIGGSCGMVEPTKTK